MKDFKLFFSNFQESINYERLVKLAHYSEEADGESLDDVDLCSHAINLRPIHSIENPESEIVEFFTTYFNASFDDRKCEAYECGKEIVDWENKTVQQYISTMQRIYLIAKKNRPSFDDKKFSALLKSKRLFDSIDNDKERPWFKLLRKTSALLTKKDTSIVEVYKGLHGEDATVPEELLQESSKSICI